MTGKKKPVARTGTGAKAPKSKSVQNVDDRSMKSDGSRHRGGYRTK